MTRIARFAGVLLAALLASSAPAAAATQTQDFDSFPAGTAITDQIPGVSFGFPGDPPPEATPPLHTYTYTSPNALRAGGPCTSEVGGCPTAHRLRINFSTAQNAVGLRAGLDDVAFESGTSARLTAFTADGTFVSSDGPRALGQGGNYNPIERPFLVTDPTNGSRIAYVVLNVGQGTGQDSGPQRAWIDRLEYTVPDSPIPPPSLPAPPAIEITAPADGSSFRTADEVRLNARITAPGGIANFCTSVDNDATIPADCGLGGSAEPSGVLVPGLHEGVNRITAWVRDNYGRVASATIEVEVLGRDSTVDLRTTAIEVTQGIQAFSLPINATGSAAYTGAKLVANSKTVVRVFANAASTGRVGGPLRRVPAVLHGEDERGRPLPGSPLSPMAGPRDLSRGPLAVNILERADPNGAYTFTLPASWTRGEGRIALRAVTNPSDSAAVIRECAACGANNSFRLTGLNFEQTGVVDVSPIAVGYRPRGGTRTITPRHPYVVFAETRNILPLEDGNFRVHPYAGYIDASDVAARFDLQGNDANSAVFDRVAAFEDGRDLSGVPIGVNSGPDPATGLARGLMAPVLYAFPPRIELVAVVDDTRPLTSVAHEFLHTQRYFHAGHGCPTDFPFIHWSGDDRGHIHGIGLDRRTASGGTAGPYAIKAAGNLASPPLEGQPRQWYDVMSYCQGEDNKWIALETWNSFGGALPLGLPEPAPSHPAPETAPVTPRAAAGAAQAEDGMLHVGAQVRPDGTASILRVESGSGETTSAAQPSPYRIVVRGAGGDVISDTAVEAPQTHNDFAPGQIGTVIDATVPGSGARSVELVRDGSVIARRDASATAPAISITNPRSGARIKGTGRVPLRWEASDGDGDDVRVRVEYSDDDGATYRTISVDAPADGLRLPARLFTSARAARVRVVANDGFNEGEAISDRFRAAGSRPDVRITSPERNTTVRADATLYLSGDAYDGAGEFIEQARRYTWFDGRRRLGRGPRVDVTGLRPGTHTLRLVVRDRRGRTGRDSVRVRAQRVNPDFAELSAPGSISRSARSVKLRVASTYPATLVAGGRRFRVAHEPRSIRVRVRPGSKPLRLRLRLRSGSASATRVLRIRR